MPAAPLNAEPVLAFQRDRSQLMLYEQGLKTQGRYVCGVAVNWLRKEELVVVRYGL